MICALSPLLGAIGIADTGLDEINKVIFLDSYCIYQNYETAEVVDTESTQMDSVKMELTIDSLGIKDVGCLPPDYGSIEIFASGGAPPYTYDISLYDPFQEGYVSISDSSYVEDILFTGEILVTVTDSVGNSDSRSDTLRYADRENLYEYAFSRPGFELVRGDNTMAKGYRGDLCVGDTLVVMIPRDSASVYQWNTGTLAQTDTIIAENPGAKIWYVTNIVEATGCQYFLFLAVNNLALGEGDCRPLATGDINNAQLSIYPNPVSDVVHFQGTDSNPLSVEIFSSDGQLLFSKRITTNSLDVSFLPQGTYHIRAGNNYRSTYSKLIKI